MFVLEAEVSRANVDRRFRHETTERVPATVASRREMHGVSKGVCSRVRAKAVVWWGGGARIARDVVRARVGAERKTAAGRQFALRRASLG